MEYIVSMLIIIGLAVFYDISRVYTASFESLCKPIVFKSERFLARCAALCLIALAALALFLAGYAFALFGWYGLLTTNL